MRSDPREPDNQLLDFHITYADTINGVYPSLNTLEKRIADYLLQHGEQCRHLSARELADLCQCSAASVVRFARRLNYDGYPDLRRHIRTSLTGYRQDNLSLSSAEQTDSMMRKALTYASVSLQSTVSGIDVEVLDRAAQAILKASTVLLCAMSSAVGAAMAASSQLLLFGVHAIFPVEELQQLRFAACLKPGDVLIGINYNNSAKNVGDALMTAKKRGAVTILITGVKAGVLSRYADYVFYTPLRRTSNALNISASTLCQSMILQLLILRMWQLAPTAFDQEARRISSYTKMKLYSPAVDRITLSHCEQSRPASAPEPPQKL